MNKGARMSQSARRAEATFTLETPRGNNLPAVPKAAPSPRTDPISGIWTYLSPRTQGNISCHPTSSFSCLSSLVTGQETMSVQT